MFIIILLYSNISVTDPYTMRAYSLEHKQCYNIVIGDEKYVYISTTSAQGHFTTCSKLLFHWLKIQPLHGILMGSPMVVTLSQQYNVGERSTMGS